MTPPQAVFHALLRPAIIQILRATGYHSAKPVVIDSLTDLAARYLNLLCEETARHASDNTGDFDYNGAAAPTVVDVRLALQDVGAFLPERDFEDQSFTGQEDTRGVDDFVAWAMGPKNENIRRIALDGSEEGVTDYLSALKKRHSKTADDSRYTGTLLGKPHNQGLVVVEGHAEIDSIRSWVEKQRGPSKTSPDTDTESRPASSGLSSIGTMDGEMDLS
ncbi:bromodomain associated domain protein [Diaporthe amygdali]|uniref:bromodomain associated domain protein n=1 Tax=Phomopsis amygdali TaxID=1214568 RepID=UPI0022FDD459|nr:bromodomain associated domain protein [Diaporthe amygdali]KAJ0121639.1 bromodomain associated domain protein [Diaporthe amygdali]